MRDFRMDDGPGGRRGRDFALVLELEPYRFLIDLNLLWGPARVRVQRRGGGALDVWLDESNVAPAGRGGFDEAEERRVLRLVRGHLDELRDAWFDVRNDHRRGRLHRHRLV